MNRPKWQNSLIWILASLSFVCLPLIIDPPPIIDRLGRICPMTLRNMVSALMTLMYFYGSYFYLVPELYFRKKYAGYLVLSLGALLLITYIPFELIHVKPPEPPHGAGSGSNFGPPRGFGLHELSRTLFAFLSAAFVSLSLRINHRLRSSEKEKLNAELSFLKAQMNPHFLFNTLNSIYSLTVNKSDQAPEAVVQLSGMMRYITSEAHAQYVLLGKELDYISNYVALQRLRLGRDFALSYQLSGERGHLRIAPLLLIPFVENAFKHGVNPEQDCAIDIRIEIKNQMLELRVINKIVDITEEESASTGMGLNNVRYQLNMLYIGKHTLDINTSDNTYSVHLKISLS